MLRKPFNKRAVDVVPKVVIDGQGGNSGGMSGTN